MARSRTIASRLYQPGTRTVDLRTIPVDSNGMRITLTRESWPEADVAVEIVVRSSRDDGATWSELGRVTFPGGELRDRTGSVVATSWLEREWPGEWDRFSRRALRGTDIEITFVNHVPLRTAVTLEAI